MKKKKLKPETKYETYCSACGTYAKDCTALTVYAAARNQPPLAFLCGVCWKRGIDAGLIGPPGKENAKKH